jgi:hypothetical protein
MDVSIDDRPIRRDVEQAENDGEAVPAIEAVPTIEELLRQELRQYAVELRKLAYALPNGIGEQALLRLCEHMTMTADRPLFS